MKTRLRWEELPGMPGFCVGSDGQGARLAQGQFEEVFTFSRACTADELAWNWQVQGRLAARGPISEEEAKALVEGATQLKAMPRTETGGMSRLDLDPDRLSVEVRWSQPSDLIVTLHKTIPGALYQLWSKEDLSLAEWTP